jgi:hypothetical protein
MGEIERKRTNQGQILSRSVKYMWGGESINAKFFMKKERTAVSPVGGGGGLPSISVETWRKVTTLTVLKMQICGNTDDNGSG